MLNRKLLIIISLLYFQTSMASTHVYELKSITKKITMTFEDKPIVNDKVELNLDLKIKILGATFGSMSEKTLTHANYIPELDSRCRSPRRRGKKYNCFSSKFKKNGEFLITEFNGKKPILNRDLTVDISTIRKIHMKMRFPEFDINRDEVYNLTSLYFLTLSNDFGTRYHDRVLFVTGSKELFKIQLKVLDDGTDSLVVKLNVLKSFVEKSEMNSNTADEQSGSTLPGKFIYSKSRGVVTSLYLKTQKNTYELHLKK